MKAKGVGNKPAPYLLVFTLFLGAVYLSAIFRTEYFCRQEGSEFMAKSKGGVTVSKVWELCQPIVEGFGLSLWDVRYVKEGADRFLRVYIDKPEGREFKGVLKDYSDGKVTIEDHSGENEITISKKDAAWIKLDDFD